MSEAPSDPPSPDATGSATLWSDLPVTRPWYRGMWAYAGAAVILIIGLWIAGSFGDPSPYTLPTQVDGQARLSGSADESVKQLLTRLPDRTVGGAYGDAGSYTILVGSPTGSAGTGTLQEMWSAFSGSGADVSTKRGYPAPVPDATLECATIPRAGRSVGMCALTDHVGIVILMEPGQTAAHCASVLTSLLPSFEKR